MRQRARGRTAASIIARNGLSATGGGGRREFDLLVQIGKGEIRAHGFERQHVFQAVGRGEEPAAVGHAGVEVGVDPIRGEKQVLAEGFDGLVALKFAATVVGFGGR